jgi:hypothetical protein
MNNLFEQLNELQGQERIDKVKEYESIFGITNISPYSTWDTEVFEEKLAEMSLMDMRALASKIGVNPMQDRPKLKEGLRISFKQAAKDKIGKLVPAGHGQAVLDENNPKHKEAIKIMKDV